MSMIGIIVSILLIFGLFLIAARGGLNDIDNSGEFEQEIDEEEESKEI